MRKLELNDELSFGIESENKKLRLIVFNNGKEYVCHKSTAGELTRFLNNDEEQLFKGRLQLLKNNDNILVKVKGNIEGALNKNQLAALLLSENAFVAS